MLVVQFMLVHQVAAVAAKSFQDQGLNLWQAARKLSLLVLEVRQLTQPKLAPEVTEGQVQFKLLVVNQLPPKVAEAVPTLVFSTCPNGRDQPRDGLVVAVHLMLAQEVWGQQVRAPQNEKVAMQ